MTHKIDAKFNCPICREPNVIINQALMRACENNDDCAICFANKSNVFLPACGHLCICDICATQLDTIRHISELDNDSDEDIYPLD
jgi:hypothetical protein